MFTKNSGVKFPGAILAVILILLVRTGYGQPLDLGHQVLRDKGLQVMALVFNVRGTYPFDPARWAESNFGTVDWGQGRSAITVTESLGIDWILQGNDANELTPDPSIPAGTDGPYSHRVMYEIGHEPHITSGFTTGTVDLAVLADYAQRYVDTRAAYPNIPVTTKLRAGPGFMLIYDDSAIQAFVDTVQPDYLVYSDYPFFNAPPSPPPPHHPNHFIRLAQYRDVGLASGIPYGTSMQTFTGVDNLRVPTESDVRFDQFTALTYGFKILASFIYDGWNNPSITPVLFSDNVGTANPTPLFFQLAASNTEVRNIASSLVYLLSTDVRYVTAGTLPTRTVAWQAGASDPYITGISVTSASPEDLVIGYFTPMLETDDGPTFSNQIYFMVTNAKHAFDMTAADAAQTIQVDFDFLASGITSLQRMNRLTGVVESIVTGGSYDGLVYTQLGATTYRATLTLPGGTGDLFKFNTGAFFVNGKTCSDVGVPLLADANGDCYVGLEDFSIIANSLNLCNDPEDPLCTVDCSDPVNAGICQ